MNWQTSYSTPAPTAPAEGWEYSSSQFPDSPTTSAPQAGNYYPSNELAAIKTITCTVTATEIITGDSSNGNTGLDYSTSEATPDQEAIIALGVVCGLLAIGVAILLFIILWKRKKREDMRGRLRIAPGFGGLGGLQWMGRHKRRHNLKRTEYSRGGADDMTDYFSPVDRFDTSRKHRGHRRSHPVTSDEYDGINRAGLNSAQWGNTRFQQPPAAYTQFPNPGAPVYFSPGRENRHDTPLTQEPRAHPRRGRDEESAGRSEVSSSSSQEEVQGADQRLPSARRHHSKSSSFARGRSGHI